MARRSVSVIELAGYQRRAAELLNEEEQDAVIDLIAYEPTCGDLIPGTGGLRKVRIGLRGRGTRGGARIVYYFYDVEHPPAAGVALCQEREIRLERPGKERVCYVVEGDRGAMAKKVKKRKSAPTLADDIRASLQEALAMARGEKTGAVVHYVTPRDSDAREARLKLGLSQREFAAVIGTGVGTVRKWELGTRRPSGAARALIEVIKREPKAVRRALKTELAS